MKHLVIALLIAVLSPLATGNAQAQVSERAYAPENIGSLSVSDQIRVIEKEYREQSRGREIPDDQLDFYLDQIKHARWTFSKIKNDIAVSLRGNGSGGNWRPPSGGNWNATSIICSSTDRRYRECRTPFRGRARLTQNISDTRCVEGRNWGARNGLVWVDDGCRARFSDSGNGWGNNNGQNFRCESDNNRYRECRKPNSGYVQLVRNLSNQQYIEGRNWGQKSNTVWVSSGCRGEFRTRDGNWGGNGSNNGYTVTCVSDGRLRTCAWDNRRGTPRLIERLSNNRCDQGRDWGYDSRGLWVDNGCRARFGSR
jgi:Protein of unknown function (DUF3011)